MVDPDNRRAVDFATRAHLINDGLGLEETLVHWRDGRAKAKLTVAALKVRRAAPELFTVGDYLPLEVEGEKASHIVAFARIENKGRVAVVVAPRLTLNLLGNEPADLLPPAAVWGDTFIRLPSHLASMKFADALGGQIFEPGAMMPVSSLLAKIPLALVVTQ
ncbi:MAG: hypothetical protein Q8M31_20975 [Beijerinckiaceae bacterium]|nr:hypothetical protein [Beijerinckiaceae bacterium]